MDYEPITVNYSSIGYIHI